MNAYVDGSVKVLKLVGRKGGSHFRIMCDSLCFLVPAKVFISVNSIIIFGWDLDSRINGAVLST